jgi:RNA polymerase sigma-70 factor (ECF subfamily)
MGVVELVQAASINVMATVAIAPSLRTTGMMPPSVVAQCSRNGTSNDRLPGELAQVTRAETKFLYPIAELGNATARGDNHVVVGARDREPDPEGNEGPILELPSFERAFEENFAAIHRYIARRVGVPLADDLAAETFATAFRRRASFDPVRGSLRSWLYGIATNLLRNHWRAEQHLLDLDSRLRAETELRENPSLPDEQLSASFVAPRIAAALRTLVGEQREILLLHAWAELSHEEIAVALDIPPGTVRSRLSRACAALREELHGFDFDLWEFEGTDIPAVSEGNEHD